jgi:large subunit ribosomal protein L29
VSAEELKGLGVDELKAKERELEEDLFHLRLQHATGQLRNSARLRTVRRDIARVKTVLGERGRGT